MSGILGIVSGLIGGVGKIIDDVSTTDEERLAAQAKLSAIEATYQVEIAQVDAEFARAQAAVITAEAKSQSWLARNWRPLLMLSFGVVILYNYFVAPLLSLTTVPIEQDMWGLLKLGIGGYIVGRSAEKIAPSVATALGKK